MAFSYTIRANDQMGKGFTAGTWSAASVTTGAITTGFNEIIAVALSNNVSNTCTWAKSGAKAISITCTSNDTGSFMIYGS